ncbi:MAG: phosphoribosylformylglycinamidine synthase subunit PurS [Candidatus Adiutrix sp.]|jgi:phosphoribosylformylglycinamidine synthase|nr:phosphoribosylformylglycinamidine synthase subunit PurS [Candidatus Adiutrix sp.]
MKFKAQVIVRLKKSVLDPQGAAVERALKSHGHGGLESVRIGKIVELELEGESVQSVEARVAAWADRLLANPILETFTVTVEERP